MPDTQPLDPTGQRRVAGGSGDLARLDSARRFRQQWWPGTGSISVVVGPDRRPRVQYAKERISLSEAAGYFEFLMEQLAADQRRTSPA
jgi:hypothetical protein